MGSGTDNLPVSFGVGSKLGGRSAPTVWNSAFLSVQFWDGRAPSLEDQAKGPMLNPVEMGMGNHDLVIKRISAIPEYRRDFKRAFKTRTEMEALTIDNTAKAIAAYERTLVTPDSPFDRFARGEKTALTASALRGLKIFQRVGCVSCHNGPNFSGPALPEGTGFYQKFPVYPGSSYEARYELTKDTGRQQVTHSDADRGIWRVPSLRNIALTGPYFHNGSVKTLTEAVKVMAKTQLNQVLPENEVVDLVSFLGSLSGKFPSQSLPRLPESPNGNAFID